MMKVTPSATSGGAAVKPPAARTLRTDRKFALTAVNRDQQTSTSSGAHFNRAGVPFILLPCQK